MTEKRDIDALNDPSTSESSCNDAITSTEGLLSATIPTGTSIEKGGLESGCAPGSSLQRQTWGRKEGFAKTNISDNFGN